jgi:hypothetical protein
MTWIAASWYLRRCDGSLGAVIGFRFGPGLPYRSRRSIPEREHLRATPQPAVGRIARSRPACLDLLFVFGSSWIMATNARKKKLQFSNHFTISAHPEIKCSEIILRCEQIRECGERCARAWIAEFFGCANTTRAAQAEFRRFNNAGEFHFPFRSNLIAK